MNHMPSYLNGWTGFGAHLLKEAIIGAKHPWHLKHEWREVLSEAEV